MIAPPLVKRMLAETVGTFWLVFGGIGTALLASHNVQWLGVSLAFGLIVITMAYAIGHISGCHLNPAVSIGLCVGGRFPARDLPGYILAQLVGAILGAGLLFIIARGGPAFVITAFEGVSNGYGAHSPMKYSMLSGFVTETALTFMFLVIIMGATDRRAPQGFAPLAIGLGLTVIHLFGIPVTNLSVNPARSSATAIFAGGWAITQLWLFWVAPILGGILGGLFYSMLGAYQVESPQGPLEKLAQQSEARGQRAENINPT